MYCTTCGAIHEQAVMLESMSWQLKYPQNASSTVLFIRHRHEQLRTAEPVIVTRC
jgi:hypothetical protein